MSKSSAWFILPLAVVSLITACGKDEEPTTTPPSQPAVATSTPVETAKPEEAPLADTSVANGEKVFKSTCAMCHQTGAAGAPIVGNKEEWAPRIAQGVPTLYDHALKGFTGTKGMMPAKGANPALTDAEVQAAVDYMVDKAK